MRLSLSLSLSLSCAQAEGSSIAAAINASTLALADAGIPMRDLLVASTAGLLQGCPVVDLNREEELWEGT